MKKVRLPSPMMTSRLLHFSYSILLLVCLVAPSQQFQSRLDGWRQKTSCGERLPTHWSSLDWNHLHETRKWTSFLHSETDIPSQTIHETPATSSHDFNAEIERLCQSNQVDRAFSVLSEAEERLSRVEDCEPRLDETSYVLIMKAWLKDTIPHNALRIEALLEKMKTLSKTHVECTPTARSYQCAMFAWSKSFTKEAGKRCEILLSDLWSRFESARDIRLKPTLVTYSTTLIALARSGSSREGAERAERLLEEMERLREQYPSLTPNTVCVNAVLHAWSKSNSPEASERCEAILNMMEELYRNGRKEMEPNTNSYNIVLDAFARSRGSERRAEALLNRMDEQSSVDAHPRWACQPDAISFNTVLNCWARSSDRDAARRADAILRHMERRYADGNTDVQPGVLAYNTVLTAWARSMDREASKRAEVFIQRMDDAVRGGNVNARPNAITHNVMLNILAKSRDPRANIRAMQTFENMKALAEKGYADCRPDVVTYTSLIGVLAKSSMPEMAEKAIDLLEELEESYHQTGDPALKPNIRTYTSVIHAIARSNTRPERAEAIVNRLEALSDPDLRPDVVCYDALVNAFGWSNAKGKSKKCFAIFEKMLDLYNSGRNLDAKPDIITCNSVLNACAFEDVDSDEDRRDIMDIAVRTLEEFQSNAPTFGWPNHISFANVLLALHKHMPETEKRMKLAEATFWQCCDSGHLSVLVVNHMHKVLPYERLAFLLGESLSSAKGEPLRFNWRLLPTEWTRFAPAPREHRTSRPSRKQPARTSLVKSSITQRRQESQ